MTTSQSRTESKAKTPGTVRSLGATESDRRAKWAGGQHKDTGPYHGGRSEADDALPDRGYTIHVGSLQELRGLL